LLEGEIVERHTEEAIHSVVNRFIDSWNQHDMSALAGLFADDADFVDVFGNWFKDKEAIERALTQRHATVFRESRFTAKEVVVRLLKPDLAVVHAAIELSGAFDREGRQLPAGLGVITSVIENTGEGWRIVALQNTAVAQATPGAK
jgi:uncharacterized protein (TIGR02246 family)